MPTISDLPIGAKLKFGAYSVSGEAPHKICWTKVHLDNTILSEFIEDQCAFDAIETNNYDDCRNEYGNNRYSLSNVHQFLNAGGPNWFNPTHESDEPPEDRNMYNGRFGYNHKPGFTQSFEDWEIESIEVSEIRTALPETDIYERVGKCETIYEKIFMPSKTNVGLEPENGVQEGETWDLFAGDGAIRTAQFSNELYDYSENYDKPEFEGLSWYYYLRSPNANTSSNVRCIRADGSCRYANAYCDYIGIRPALKLNPETLVSIDPDYDGYYEVYGVQQETVEIDENEFLSILKKT